MLSFIADENIPYLTIKELRNYDISIKSVYEIMRGGDDFHIVDYAFKNKLIIITFDKDFGEIVFKFKKKSFGVILLRDQYKNHNDLTKVLRNILNDEAIISPQKFIVVKKGHIRSIDLEQRK